MDCGAYRGDTVEKFVTWSGGKYEKIFAIEADNENFLALEKFIRDKNFSNVSTFNCGVWHEKTKLTFDSTSNTSSTISESGNVTINAEKIDDLIGGESVNFIKMDIEGAELNALRGAVETIKRNVPTLAICVYHKLDDLITIPQFIKNLYGDYKFYLRKHIRVLNNELVLYGVK